MKKRFLIIFLLMILVFNFTFQPVFSIEPVTLSATAYLVGKLLVAAGVTFYAADGLVSAYNHWNGFQNDTVHGMFQNAIDNAVNGVVNITDSMWNNIRDYVQGNYNVGSNSISSQQILSDSFPPSPIPISVYPYQFIVSRANGTHLGLYGSKTPLFVNHEHPTRIFNSDNSAFIWYGMYSLGWDFPTTNVTSVNLGSNNLIVRASNSTILNSHDSMVRFFITNPIFFAATAIPAVYYNYSGQSVISNPQHDFQNLYTQNRDIIMPTVYNPNNLVGLTHENISTFQPPRTVDLSYPSNWYGSWSNSGAGVGTWDGQWTQGNNTTDKPMVGVPGNWIGDWFLNPDGTLTWDGSYSDGSGNVWEGEVSGVIKGTGVDILNPPLTPTLTGITDFLGNIVTWLSNIFTIGNATLNFEPLRLSLYNKFPFSIPWDFYNAIQSLNADAEVPRWELPIVDEIVVLDFTIFNPIAKIIRWGVLVSFTFSLILITRSLIKG